MKHVFLALCLLLGWRAAAQDTVESLVRQGIEYHDAGDYATAISIYLKALMLDENSSLVNYELALSYLAAKEFEKSLSHAEKVIAQNDEHLLQAYVAKANCLDDWGQREAAIDTYLKAIKAAGPHYLLYYNLGLSYYRANDWEKAEAALINALADNANHASSHLLLGYLMADEGNKVQSILSLHYFLFLEANSGRSEGAYTLLSELFGSDVERTGPNDISIMLNASSLDKKNDFGSAEMMISMLAASNTLKEKEGKTKEEMFKENTESFFKILGETKKKKNKGLWWEFYVPFFYELAKTRHIETYCHYVGQTNSEVSVNWLAAHEERIVSFNRWISER